MKLVAVIVLSSWFAASLPAQTFRTVNNPPNFLWSDPNSWDLASVPTIGDTVIFNNNHTIVVNSTTGIDRVILRGNSNLTVNNGISLNIAERLIVQQISANNTQNLVADGTINVGDRFLVRSSRDPNGTSNISGTGSINVTDRAVFQGDTSNFTVNLTVPIQTGTLFICQLTRADAEMTINAQSSIIVGTNFILNANNGSDSLNNIFNMQFAGSSLQVGNNINLNNSGGFLQNNSTTSTSVILTTFNKYRTDSRLQFHDLHFITTGVVNGDRTVANVLGNFIINSGCNLSLNRRTLNIENANLIVNGTIGTVNNDDSLILSGSSAQTISGTGNIETEYLIVNNSAGVSNSVSTTINRGLKIQSGNFNTGNVVRLNSTSTRSAYLNEIGNNGVGASISGNLICERNIDGVTTVDYRHFTSPVSGSTLLDIQDGVSPEGFWTYGYTGSNTPSAGGVASCYTYDPNGTWVAATSTGNNISANNGLSVYCGGASGTNGAGAKSSYDIEVTGTPNVGPITFTSVNSTISGNSAAGVNQGFIGNPFPSTINWNAVTKSNVSNIAQVYGSQDYGGYRATNFNAVAARIPPFQAFWVQTTGSSPSVTFNENDKILNNIPFRKNALFEERFYFHLIPNATQDTVSATVELNNNSTGNYDANNDGLVFENPYPLPSLYSLVNDSLFAQVNSLPRNTYVEIPIVTKIQPNQHGNHTFFFSEYPKHAICARLRDSQTGSVINIYDQPSYQFYASSTDFQPRFTLILDPLISETSTKNLSCFGEQDGELSVEFNAKRFTANLYSNNKKIPFSTSGNHLKAQKLRSGNYYLVLEDQAELCRIDTLYSTIFEPSEITAGFLLEHKANYSQIRLTDTSIGSSQRIWRIEGNQFYDKEITYQFDKNGDKEIELIVYNHKSCADTVKQKFVISTLTESENQVPEIGFTLEYSHGEFKIRSLSDQNNVEGKVFDSTGSVVEQFRISSVGANQHIDLKRHVNTALLFVEISSDGGYSTFKLPAFSQ